MERDGGAIDTNVSVDPHGFEFVNPSTFSLGTIRILAGAGGPRNVRVVDFGPNPLGTIVGGTALGTVAGVNFPAAVAVGSTLTANGTTVDLSSLGIVLQAGRVYAIRLDGGLVQLGTLGTNPFADVGVVTGDGGFPNFTGFSGFFDSPFQLFALIIAPSTFSPSLVALATNGNQRAIATVLDGLFATASSDLSTTYLLAFLAGPSALDAMSPASFTFAEEIALSNSWAITNILANNLAHVSTAPRGAPASLSLDLFGPDDLVADGGGIETPKSKETELPYGWRVTARGLGGFEEQNGTRREVGFDSQTAGALFTFDRTWGVSDENGTFHDALTAGLAGAYAASDVDFSSGRGSADIESYHVGPYLGIQMEGFHANFMFLYGFNDYETERRIAFPGVSRTAKSDHNANQYTGRFDFGHTWREADWSITPWAGLEVVRLDQRGFSEGGAGALALRVSDRDTDSLRSLLGLRHEHGFETGGPRIVPALRAAWIHEFLDDDRDVTARFAGTAPEFTVRGRDVDRDRARLGAGLRIEGGKNVSGLLDYDVETDADDTTAHSLTGGIEFKW
ncbi:MAG: autotransporter outer membrane beta-barrel domain-containing protein [Planctomycetes bacterium]|nr:autotransporter outer membrane beta-barrel domain-containing protein [Planctomycetota bacterium]